MIMVPPRKPVSGPALGRLTVAALAAVTAALIPLAATPASAATSLRGLAEGQGRYFGTELTQETSPTAPSPASPAASSTW